MKRTLITTAIIAASLALTACDRPQTSAQSAAKPQPSIAVTDAVTYEKFTLDNGLEVIFHLDHSDPVVAVSLTSHVGSARELPGRTGFAHLFEHLLFLESENLGKGGLDKLSARIGGSGANGSTSRDRTNYFQTVPNDALEKMLWAEADKLGFFINTVTDAVLAKEKQVVKNEKRQGVDNQPYGHTHYVIGKNLYPEGHPYNWQVIGSLEDLQNATLADVKAFFKRWYVPNNVTLVVSGDFDAAQAKQWVHKYFDEIPRGEEVTPLAKTPVVLNQSKHLVHEDNFAKLPELTLTWPTVPQYHADSYALDMLVELLSEGKKAPLNKVLIDDEKLTANVGTFNYQSELAGQLMLSVRAFNGVDLDKVEAAINRALLQFEQDAFTEADLDRIKAGQETAHYQSMASVLGKGFQLAQYNLFLDDPGFINQVVGKIQKVTVADIWRVYHQYLKGKHFIATSFVPKGQAELALENSLKADVVEEQIVAGAEQEVDPNQSAEFAKTPSSFDRSVEPPYGSTPKIKAPDVWQSTLKNGVKVLGIENSEVPLVKVNLSIQGGALFETADDNGIANLTARLMNKGTKTKTPQQLEEAIMQLGASITVSANGESVNIEAATLARNYEKTMDLLSEMLMQPRWDQTEFALVKDKVISLIQQRSANPNAIAGNEFAKLIYSQNHPMSRSLLGTETSVNELTLTQAETFYQTYLVPNLASFHVVGDVSEQRVLTSLKTLESQWQAKETSLPALPEVKMPAKSQVYFYDVPKAKQSVLMLGYPSLAADDKDFYSANVMNYILGGGGFASKLMQDLREAKGYTYGIYSDFDGSQHGGQFTISSGVRSNVTLEALQSIKQLVENYQTDFSTADLETTQSYYLKSNARAFETMGAKLQMLTNMSQLGLSADYVTQRAADIENMTVDKVKSLAEQYIKPDNMVYLVVGDAESQLGRLEKLNLGPVIKLN